MQMGKKFQRTIVNIFLPIGLNMCFGQSKETSHQNGSFEYPQVTTYILVEIEK